VEALKGYTGEKVQNSGLKQKNLQFHKTENEGIQESDRKQSGSAGLILLFAEKRPG